MDKKQMYVQVINSETGKIFSLPTLYTDRTEACVCGQNYCRDRQAEDGTALFFRVVKAEEFHPTDERGEEPNWKQLFEEYCPNPFSCEQVINKLFT